MSQTPPPLIPVDIDAPQIIEDLNRLGWRDAKIEMACGLSTGYVAQVRGGHIKKLNYQYAARLFNFWVEETFQYQKTPTHPAVCAST